MLLAASEGIEPPTYHQTDGRSFSELRGDVKVLDPPDIDAVNNHLGRLHVFCSLI